MTTSNFDQWWDSLSPKEIDEEIIRAGLEMGALRRPVTLAALIEYIRRKWAGASK